MVSKIISIHGKLYALPIDPIWRTGSPPDIGWWPATLGRNILALRYWDGQHWSDSVPPDATLKAIERARRGRSTCANMMVWAARWWVAP